jgi:hypothetical protein
MLFLHCGATLPGPLVSLISPYKPDVVQGRAEYFLAPPFSVLGGATLFFHEA